MKFGTIVKSEVFHTQFEQLNSSMSAMKLKAEEDKEAFLER